MTEGPPSCLVTACLMSLSVRPPLNTPLPLLTLLNNTDIITFSTSSSFSHLSSSLCLVTSLQLSLSLLDEKWAEWMINICPAGQESSSSVL